MTIRSGMTELIRLIRQLAQAEDGEYEVAGETYWQDEHLQDVLDVFRTDVYEESIYPVPQFISGATVYQNYYWENPNVERADSGTALYAEGRATGIWTGGTLDIRNSGNILVTALPSGFTWASVASASSSSASLSSSGDRRGAGSAGPLATPPRGGTRNAQGQVPFIR